MADFVTSSAQTSAPRSDDGNKPVWKRWWFILGVVFVAIVALSALFGGDDDSNLATSPTTGSVDDAAGGEGEVGEGIPGDADSLAEPESEPEPEFSADTPAVIGAIADLGDGALARLNTVAPEAEPTNDIFTPDPGITLTRLDVEICAGDEPLAANPLYWSGQDAENRTYNAFLGSQGYTTIGLDPGACQRGTVDLEVPEGVTVTSVILLTPLMGEHARWEVSGDATPQPPLEPFHAPSAHPLAAVADLAAGATATVHAVSPEVEPLNEFVTAPEGHSFTRVEVEVCAGDEIRPANPLYWGAQSADHRIATSELGAQGFATRDLAPGTCERGTVDVAVPDGAEMAWVMLLGPMMDVEARWGL